MKKINPPAMMNAVTIANGRLVQARRPVPKPGRGEVLVRVHAAGVGRPDLLQRQGLYPPPPGVTDIPGLEIAGEIVGTGEKICALVPGGGYAEYCVAARALCLPLPKGYNWTQAAALPETFFTVWRNVFILGRLKAGETLLVHGGAGGIGTTAIQLAAARGATVIATARGPRKTALCRRLGAHTAIDSARQDLAPALKGKKIDVVLDMMGGDDLARNIALLAPGGRHVSIGMMKGRTAPLDIYAVMAKNLTLTGSTLRPQPLSVKAALARALRRHAWPLLATGRIAPVIGKTFPLTRAQSAHDWLDTPQATGKAVLKIAFRGKKA